MCCLSEAGVIHMIANKPSIPSGESTEGRLDAVCVQFGSKGKEFPQWKNIGLPLTDFDNGSFLHCVAFCALFLVMLYPLKSTPSFPAVSVCRP